MHFDDRNKIIFEHLLANARFPVKDLARILKVTKPAVIRRLNFLESNEYITRYDAIINWQKLQLIKKVYLLKVDSRQDTFERSFTNKRQMFSLIRLSGLYNYQAWCFFESKQQMQEFQQSIKEHEYIALRVKKLVFPRVSFFEMPLQLPLPKQKQNAFKADSTDITIMKHLCQGHGRDSFYKISRDLGIKYSILSKRAKRLISEGYFLAIVAQPGTNKLTLQTTCIVLNCSNKERAERLFEMLKKTPHVQSDAICDGSTVMVHILSRAHEQYIKTVAKVTSLVARKEIKSMVAAHWQEVLLNNRCPLEYLPA